MKYASWGQGDSRVARTLALNVVNQDLIAGNLYGLWNLLGMTPM